MKKILAFVAMLIAAPVVASEPADLSGLGLAGLQTVSDQAGMEVRGLSSSAYGAGLSTMRLFAIDPDTGATLNLNMSQFNTGSADGAVGAGSAVATGTALSFQGFDLAVGTFNVTLGGDVGGVGQSSGQNAFTADVIFDIATPGVPTFTFTP